MPMVILLCFTQRYIGVFYNNYAIYFEKLTVLIEHFVTHLVYS